MVRQMLESASKRKNCATRRTARFNPEAQISDRTLHLPFINQFPPHLTEQENKENTKEEEEVGGERFNWLLFTINNTLVLTSL